MSLAQAKQDAMRLLGVRMRCENELRKRLAEKEWTAELIDEVISWLYDHDYLNDRKFAVAYVRDKLRFHPCGRRKLRYDLIKIGVSDCDADRALESNYPFELEHRMALYFYRKKTKQGKNHMQALNYLNGKGFSYEIIEQMREFKSV